MLVKCNCNHCSAHLEFYSENAGQVISCPTCGMETKLYVPPPMPVPKVEKPTQKPSAPIVNPLASDLPSSWNLVTPAESLKRIRQETCYKTLRDLIGLVQVVFFVVAGLLAIGSVASVFAGFAAAGPAGGIVSLILGLVIAVIIVVLAIAWKQAALLLVDIADCQIQLAGKSH